MSMFGEIATAATIEMICSKIDVMIKGSKDPIEIKALKAIGIYSLTLFDWDTPTWANYYSEQFKDDSNS